MPIEVINEKWTGAVNELVLGATREHGGTRARELKVGAERCLPYLFQEGTMPNRPLVAMEVWDHAPEDWPGALTGALENDLRDPCAWARRCVQEFKADLICLVLEGTNPESANFTPDQAAATVRNVLAAVDVPLIVTGSGDKEKDSDVLSACSQAAKGENILFGCALPDNYKTLVASCIADGHSIIAESPIDINIAKQMNILITDMGFDPRRVAMNPTAGALGYGMEYAYSIMERGRLAALAGDRMLSMPFILFLGGDVWRTKEARASDGEAPAWGAAALRGPLWEAITAVCMLQAGADILVMRHPQAVAGTQEMIRKLMAGSV